MGALLGYNAYNRIVVEYAIPYQAAERKPSQVEISWKRESRIREILLKNLSTKTYGILSFPILNGDERKGDTKLSQIDIRDMMPTQVEIVVAINNAKKRMTRGILIRKRILRGNRQILPKTRMLLQI